MPVLPKELIGLEKGLVSQLDGEAYCVEHVLPDDAVCLKLVDDVHVLRAD